MAEKILVRKDWDDETLLYVFIPSMESPKNYIKRWNGGKDYSDISLDAYKKTKDATADEQRKACANYVKETGKQAPKIAQRLPRDYQQTGGDGDYTCKTSGNLFVIQDAHGVFIQAYTSLDAAMSDLDKIKKGKAL